MNGNGNVMIGVVMSVKMDIHGQMENVKSSVSEESVMVTGQKRDML